ncbi:Oxidase ucsJ [Exophiala dermatitidis]
MVQIFLTGATGYVGGQTLHAISKAFKPSQVTVACLIRDAQKAKKVQEAYPDHVRVVIGDLDNVDTIEAEAQKSDVVLQLANTKHLAAARAIVKGLTEKPRKTQPYYVQMSGASLFVIPEIKEGKYGEPSSEVWDDLQGTAKILDTIRANPSREVDNFIISQNPSAVRTALVAGPLIYGKGEGPGNQRSIQAPEIAKKTIQDGEGFRLGKGLNKWSNIHVQDLGQLFLKLTEAALNGSTQGWNDEGIYLPANGELAFGTLCEDIAKEAHAQGLIKSPSVTKTITPDEANKAMPAGAIFWGTNAVYKSSRGQKLLGWAPSAPSLQDDVPQIVKIEAKTLGKA